MDTDKQIKEGKIKKLKEEFEKLFIKPFQKNKMSFNKMQLGGIEVRDYLILNWFKQKLKEKEKEIIEDLKIKVAEAIMWNDKHPTLKDLEALYNYLDSLNSDT